jgi:hypothetical protein
MTEPVQDENENRTTLYNVIKSFLIIFCTYYWATHLWPMIKREVALRKQKSAIMTKLIRQQEEIKTERMDDESTTDSTENFGDDVISNNQPQKRFDLGHILRKVTRKPRVEASEGDPTDSMINETVDVVDSECYSEGSNRSALSGRYVMKPIKQLSGTAEILGDAKLCIENVEVSDEMNGINGGHLDHDTVAQKAANDELVSKSNIKGNKCLKKLWSHISRTAPYSNYTTYTDNAVDNNPWDGRNNLHGVYSDDVTSTIGSIHSQNSRGSAGLTYAEARELRNQQDAEYTSSLAQEELKRRIARELLESQVFQTKDDNKKRKFASLENNFNYIQLLFNISMLKISLKSFVLVHSRSLKD